MGVSSTINQCIEIAEGQYIAFLDCDDYLAPNALEEVNMQIKNILVLIIFLRIKSILMIMISL